MSNKRENDFIDLVVESAKAKKGFDIVLLDVRRHSTITDYYLIISGQNERHLKAIRDEIEIKIKENFQIYPKHIDGAPNSKWIVLDYNDFIIHIFDESMRKYYELERLWSDEGIRHY